ncbi:hypothetical protein KAR91_75730 [Candidatus Pacearchaeota archaeon]|nr:hypothetical protein [Candidatus Pacearchaeota archaeon]
MICDYGCGKEAIARFKNGKYCCSLNHKGCLNVIEKWSKPKFNKSYDLKKECNFCNRHISSMHFDLHISKCFMNPVNIKLCNCGNPIKDYKNGIACSRRCAALITTPGRKRKHKKTEILCTTCDVKIPHNRKYCKLCLIEFKRKNAAKRIFSTETKDKLRQQAIKRKFGGHTSKQSIYYRCKDDSVIYLQSSYEKRLAIDLDQNNVLWIRPGPIKWIDECDKSHYYYPDFYLTEQDIYLDPKNDYLIQKDDNKIQRVSIQNKIQILILNEHQLTWKYIQTIL